jgi:hypothetical protein
MLRPGIQRKCSAIPCWFKIRMNCQTSRPALGPTLPPLISIPGEHLLGWGTWEWNWPLIFYPRLRISWDIPQRRIHLRSMHKKNFIFHVHLNCFRKHNDSCPVQSPRWKNEVMFNPLKTKRICFIWGLSAYRAVNTLHFSYKNRSLNVL